MKKHTLLPLLAISVQICGSHSAHSQTAQYTQFDATPMLLNPANTGRIDGNFRANFSYRDVWRTKTVAFISTHTSVDAPVYTRKNGDYIGGGMLINNSKAGDGNLKNFNGLLSASYHKLFGDDSAWLNDRGCELAIGVQGGYNQLSIDLSDIYLTSPLPPLGYSPATFTLGVGNTVSFYAINTGMSFSQSLGKRFNYTIGLSITNLNQPSDALLKKLTSAVGLDIKYTTIAGCNILAGEKLSLKPAIIYVHQPYYKYMVVGNEFLYSLETPTRHTSFFCGLWYNSANMTMVSAGIRAGSFRIGVAYDYYLTTMSNPNGGAGFELALGFINPTENLRHKPLASNRF